MVKAERVLRYTKLEPEADLTSQDPPPVTWPQSGGVTFNDVNFQYHEKAPLVLKSMNVQIKPGSKVRLSRIHQQILVIKTSHP